MLWNWTEVFRRKRQTLDSIAPETEFIAFGDIHGRVDLLERALSYDAAIQKVFVGDYIDRGPDSADVLRMLLDNPQVVAISGNHEEMLSDFLDDPVSNGPFWLKNGGLQTLRSFGIQCDPAALGFHELIQIAAQLREVMGEDLVEWLAARPLLWSSGNIFVVHAGANPTLPIGEQTKKILHWGHNDFGKVDRKDGNWVLHGHSIVTAARMGRGQISIDTGAYATGELTAAHVMQGSVQFDTITMPRGVGS